MRDVLYLLFIFGSVALVLVGGWAVVLHWILKDGKAYAVLMNIVWVGISCWLAYFVAHYNAPEQPSELAWGVWLIGLVVFGCYAHAMWTLMRGRQLPQAASKT